VSDHVSKCTDARCCLLLISNDVFLPIWFIIRLSRSLKKIGLVERRTQMRSTGRKLLQKLYAQFYFIDFSLLQGEKATLLASGINIPLEEALLIMTERMEYGLWFGSIISIPFPRNRKYSSSQLCFCVLKYFWDNPVLGNYVMQNRYVKLPSLDECNNIISAWYQLTR